MSAPAESCRQWWVLLFLFLSALGLAAQTAGDFTVVVLPDTQNYSQYYPQIYAAQTQWIADQRDERNIQLVIGVGDIVNNGSSDAEWQNADAAVRTLDQDGIPYLMAIGNHDYEGSAPQNRVATHFNQYFGPQRYARMAGFGTTYPEGSNENFYATFTVNGQSYLVLVLEFVPRSGALDWARQVIAANPDKEIWLVTHSYMYGDNSRVDQCDTQDLNRDNDGEESWQSFASQYPNISLVLSGHITQDTGHRADVAADGNLVSQLLSDFQDDTMGGDGFLRILTFHPLRNVIDVQTYSPFVDSYRTDAANEFSFKWHADGIESGPPAIRGKVRAARGGYSFDCARLGDATITASAGTLATDSSGNFTVTMGASNSGQVTISVARPGYRAASQTLSAYAGYPAESDFFLQPIVGKLAGHVSDAATGAAIAGATVAFSGGADISYSKSTAASTTGDYGSGNVPVGEYQLSVSAPNYNTATMTATVTDGATTTTSVALQPAQPPPPPGCTPSGNGVKICAPASGATVSSPVTVTASAQSSAAIKNLQLYVDGVLKQTVNGSSLSVPVAMAAGSRRITVQAKDANGLLLKSTEYVTVGSGGGGQSGCTASGAGVTICSPASGATVSSPVTVTAAAQSGAPISYIQVYLDGVAQKTASGSSINVQVTMSGGTHRLTVQAKDTSGMFVKSTEYITVQ